MFDHTKYKPFTTIDIKDRTWPDQVISEAPRWCSVDLRDGNQALIEPMSVEQKKKMFALLVEVGFKEIEVGFPAASQPDFDFVRYLIEENKIPNDVTIQVLTQARPELIQRTFESLKGARQAILHVYNSTSVVQREKVFKTDKAGIIAIAKAGAVEVQRCASLAPETDWIFQYSPESFTGTEIDFAVEVCDAVADVWEPTPDKQIIFNLPSTVEVSTPNVYADQIEWFCRHIKNRDSIVVSLHTHNDRACAVGSAELAVMAGAQRVEGTLLGNGERTGNMDIVIMAMNLYSQGVDPKLDLSDMDNIVSVLRECTQIDVHPRQPYSGDLVFTAFSGSHQDAIKKCLDIYEEGSTWEIAYLPIDPRDLGRTYQDVIRVNSQSGKGGVAYILEQEFGYILPKGMHREFGPIINRVADTKGEELSADDLHGVFRAEYLDRRSPIEIHDFRTTEKDRVVTCEADVSINSEAQTLTASGNGPINAFVTAIREAGLLQFEFLNYSEHSIGSGARAQAISYIQIKPEDGPALYGAGIDTSIEIASIKGVVSAINRALAR